MTWQTTLHFHLLLMKAGSHPLLPMQDIVTRHTRFTSRAEVGQILNALQEAAGQIGGLSEEQTKPSPS